jgi:hypothetical protein
MGNDELASGMDGVGGKIEDGIGAVGAHVVEGELSEREEIGPMVRGKEM